MNKMRRIVISAIFAAALGGLIGASINHIIGYPTWMAGFFAAFITLILYISLKYILSKNTISRNMLNLLVTFYEYRFV